MGLIPLLKFETSLVEWEPARLSPQISQLPVSFLASLTRCMASFFFPSSVRNGIQVNGPSLPGQSPKQWFVRIPRAIAYPFFLYHVFDGQDDDKTGTRKGNHIIHKVKFLCHCQPSVPSVLQRHWLGSLPFNLTYYYFPKMNNSTDCRCSHYCKNYSDRYTKLKSQHMFSAVSEIIHLSNCAAEWQAKKL